MSGLQAQAQPLILRMVAGDRAALDGDREAFVARWAAMIAINLECYGHMLRTPQTQRTRLMQGHMPAGWQVFIGRMVDISVAGRSFYRAVGVPVGDRTSRRLIPLNSIYFILEDLAFYTMSSLDDEALGAAIGTMDLANKIPLARVWPGRTDAATEVTVLDLDNIQRVFGEV